MTSLNRNSADSRRQLKMRQLWAEAKKLGIDQEDLRNTIAPGIIAKRLSEAAAGEIVEVIRHITGGRAEGFSPELVPPGGYKDRFNDLGLRDGMATPDQLRKIEAMWMSVSTMPNRTAREKGLQHFLKRICGVEHLRFVEDWQVHKVIRAIEALKRRTT